MARVFSEVLCSHVLNGERMARAADVIPRSEVPVRVKRRALTLPRDLRTVKKLNQSKPSTNIPLNFIVLASLKGVAE